ncbi:hypothetical protein ACFPMF_12140 [Larkinella bovis]|uniref:Uncharacterized protein n=1 Tax=Larkinella bovis TaxID=683041 RepID=A0ABW0I9V2_9BACT
MKTFVIASLIVVCGLTGFKPNPANQAGQQAGQTVSQDTTRKDTNRLRQSNRMRRGQIEDRRPTGDPNPRQLRTDSLRRGGAMKVDTIRK